MSALQAGREADRRVAEVVMGWRWLGFPHGKVAVMVAPEEAERFDSDLVLPVGAVDRHPPERLPGFTSPDYNIKPVLDRLKSLGYQVITETTPDQLDRVIIFDLDASEMWDAQAENNLPLALADAAIQARSAAVEALEGTDG